MITEQDRKFLELAYEQAELGAGSHATGIPIGSVIVHRGEVVGAGHNERYQNGSPIRHAETVALESAGLRSAAFYRDCTIYTTLSPCVMCTGAILLYGIPRVVIGEARNFPGEIELLTSRGVEVEVVNDERCFKILKDYIDKHPREWGGDIGE